MEKFTDKTTLKDIYDKLLSWGIKCSLSTDKVYGGSNSYYITDYITVSNEDKFIEIKPSNIDKKQIYEPYENDSKKMVLDIHYQTETFEVLEVERLPKGSGYPLRSHVNFIHDYDKLKKDILHDFLNLEVEHEQISLFELEEELDEIEY